MPAKNRLHRFIVADEKLYHACDLKKLGFRTTDELESISEHIGQQRAMDALKFGIGIKHEGYNLYVLGSTGLGKHSTVKKLLEEESRHMATPPDWCYVNNFQQHHNPSVLKLPAGQGQQLAEDMDRLIDDLLVAIPAAFQSEEYRIRVQEINEEFKELEEQAFEQLTRNAEEKHITMIRTPGGYTLGPVKDDHILTPEDFDKLPEAEQQEIKQVSEEIEQQLVEIIRKVPVWQKQNRDRIREVTEELSRLTVDQFINDLLTKYKDLPKVTDFIHAVKQDIIEHTDSFVKHGEEKQASFNNRDSSRSAFTPYRVNVLVDNNNTEGAPVVYEDNPTYQNLIGRIEHVAQYGTLLTDYSLIKPGALHKANGGYLILDARKVLGSHFSWEGLKRVLRAREIRIESLEQLLSLASTTSLQPAAIPVDVKVILTGNRLLYYLLKEYDPEFDLLFKVAADFSEDIDRNDENTQLYARLIATLQRENKLNSIDVAAVGRIIEHSSRQADDGEKVSLHMGGLLDLIRESDYWALQDKQQSIQLGHVNQAIDTRRKRMDQIRERMHDLVIRDIYLLDTHGAKVGQINGLSIMQMGDYAFGRPSRITATARLGNGKVIDIEREAHLGGSIHSKGVMILSSYLANRYAPDQPLSLSASLVFEQSYGMIEGDSASAAELCALLSALSDLPINQALAVTGSINQLGEIQAIGGVNEKIEGFFEICQARGLSGEQGVVIPHSNLSHLMLREEVRQAVADRAFTIYSVQHIDQLMELLTGEAAGDIDQDGRYPKGSINARVQQKLRKLTRLRMHYGHDDQHDDDDSEKPRPYARKH
jgi:lon-related putative ATP-dependent protease